MESVELVNSATQSRANYSPTFELFLKRAFDVTLSLCALVCLVPLAALLMVAIVLESPGSPIFAQLRVGQNGRLFRIFKLRTMFVGSHVLDFKTRQEDNRLTRVGVWLRRLNLDELPQLVNVLIGDMSIIGPRPLSQDETTFLTGQGGFSVKYPGLTPGFKPGLVGLEQVNRNKDLTYSERFAYNHKYETHWSPMSDITILVKAMCLCSPVCVAVGSGAAILIACFILVH